MPSLEHEALVDMFREQPTLVAVLLRALHVDIPPHAAITVAEPVLGQVKPTELRADLVLEMCDARGLPRLATVLEVQLQIDERKLEDWPAYLTTHRERRRCDTCVLVVTPSREVATWARRPIHLGPGNPNFRVQVLGPDEVPVVTDAATAVAHPSLAVLSALAHGNDDDDVLSAALDALGVVDNASGAVYLHLIRKALSQPRRDVLEAMSMLRNIPHDLEIPQWVHDFYARRDRRSRERGQSVLLVLDARGVVLTPEQRSRIETCVLPLPLEKWLKHAATAQTAADVFADDPAAK